jgi:hypothetical protein
MPRALHGDEWHPLIPSPLGKRVRVRGEIMGIHPHLNPPPPRDKLGICDKGEEIFLEKF